MSTDKKLKNRLNLQIDEETLKITRELREKYNINISSAVRNFLIDTYKKLKNDKNM